MATAKDNTRSERDDIEEASLHLSHAQAVLDMLYVTAANRNLVSLDDGTLPAALDSAIRSVWKAKGLLDGDAAAAA
ncbi:MAG: hypothetical protein CVU28_13335 [Betaproteobacteria bacterium HGW-Betaproteobacteria-21]|nr:MAG: hypothetical protein CVU28_13335 [Betaproteobacteria bacterium HGW-Betaproteobacteria-21]